MYRLSATHPAFAASFGPKYEKNAVCLPHWYPVQRRIVALYRSFPMPCPKSDCRIPRRSGMESPVCCSDAQRLACASKTSQQLVSKNGGLYNGQLFTFSILAASLVCSSPALAERAANPADLEAYKVATYQAPIRVAYNPRESRSRALPAAPLQLRGNACVKSVLAVERLPVSSRSMQDILDHCGLLGDDMQSGASRQPVPDKDASALPVLVAAAAAHPDQQVHANNCTSCHSGY
jgi:hypothetical protein